MKTRELIRDIIQDVAILDGTNVGPSDASWQDVAGTLACNLDLLSRRLHRMREPGMHPMPLDLPAIEDFTAAIEVES